MHQFNSATRNQKDPQVAQATREPQGVQFLMARVQSLANRRTGGAVVAFTSANPGEGVSHVVQFFAEKLASQTGRPSLVIKADRLDSLRASDLLLDMPPPKTGHAWPGSEAATANGNGNGNGHGNGNGNGHGNGHGNGANGSIDHEKLRELESLTGLDLLHSLRGNLGYTLIDCASLSASGEAAMLAREVDGVVLVVAADRTKRDQILRATQTIEMAQGNLMGVVLNRRRHVVPDWFYRRL